MGKCYEELKIEMLYLQVDDVVRTSAGDDPFDDGYVDPNLGFAQ